MTLADFCRHCGKGVASAALFLLLAAGCRDGAPPADQTVISGPIMGTVYNVKITGSLSAEASAEAARVIEEILHRIDQRMSTYKPDSELSRLNRAPGGEAFALSEETFGVVALAQEVHRETGGAFDITVGPLVNAWGFGPNSLDKAPDTAELETLRALAGPGKISLNSEAHTVAKAADGVYCDLSAIAKGYAADQVGEALAALGHVNYMVEIGGEVRAAGLNARGAPWKLAIEKPLDGARAVEVVVGLSGVSLATSGNYRNFYEVDGKRISHTIDPATGRPVEHSLASASVIHPECALADAYATALMVLGPEKGLAFAEARGLAAFLIIHGEDGALITKQTPVFAGYVAE